ncbi:NADH-quinone oxidoreductase subunit J family protein [Thermocrinis minervae]|uniref:NADH-quinone oxidoreductase subunit J n=1 Tax=Thermocrinis minervae TaxID=381751 RepID=A0A1M6TMI2_9AQUI|nr:NADH-quinone oxidoreductase subunit J [Thermocrinis minervae]SHK58262.1 NADH dehydrogenase subunit J [Thermocrinis minervae]
MEWLIFGFLSLWAVLSGLGVVFLRNPVHAILSFLSLVLALSGMFLHLKAELLAGLQLIIYAVAIVVFYVLIITAVPWEKVKKFEGIYKKELLASLPFITVAFLAISYLVLKGFTVQKIQEPQSDIKAIGKLLFTQYLFPLEISAVILLVAMIGAILIGRKE